MPVDHYENFPVASILVPARLRQPIEVIYRFARSADDIADEGDATPEQRLAELAAYQAELDRIASREPRKRRSLSRWPKLLRSHACRSSFSAICSTPSRRMWSRSAMPITRN
jgi:phytoene/squalene synthetase